MMVPNRVEPPKPLAAGIIILCALAGLGALMFLAPGYLAHQGFPLDDAWIHQVYARSLSDSLLLAYNPGISATGATSPLWPLVLAVPHLITKNTALVVLLTKLIGFSFHVMMVFVLFVILDNVQDNRDAGGGHRTSALALMVSILVLLHPDLVAASVSGMEVPFATLVGALLLLFAWKGRVVTYGVVSVVAPLVRPELPVLSFLLPMLLFWDMHHRKRLFSLLVIASIGTAATFGVEAVRNLFVSGKPLIATFYAKAWKGNMSLAMAEFTGFTKLLGNFDITGFIALLFLAAVVALWKNFTTREPDKRVVSTSMLVGLFFCGVSFALIKPVDPKAFYHQRYVLPVLPLLVMAIPVLVIDLLDFLVHSGMAWTRVKTLGAIVKAGVLFFMLIISIIDMPWRLARLANDTRNIDDVQVQMGKFLAHVPQSTVVWAVDAGAIRYFGHAFIVDMMGLNNAQLLGAHAQKYLNQHPPVYLDIMPGWSRIDPRSAEQMKARIFKPSTPYTVTSFAPMQTRWLVHCPPGFPGGTYFIRGRYFRFVCADL